MPGKARPYERFGSYLLFKQLHTDCLGELWRAGKLQGDALGGVIALRRLTGGNRAAFIRAATAAREIIPALTGTTIVRDQVIDVGGGIPFVAHEYSGGRSLRTIVEKARSGATKIPIPIDQALSIVEKAAASAELVGNIKVRGVRLVHGALIPDFIWITEEGEVRTAGQQLGRALVTSLRVPEVDREIGVWFAPELRETGEPSKETDVYALGALLHFVLTGEDPPAPLPAAVAEKTIANATMMGETTLLPLEVRTMIQKALAQKPQDRFPDPSAFRGEIGKLIQSGNYAPTTFNLAFYVHTLLKKEMESESADRVREESVDVHPYVEEIAAAAAAAASSAADHGADHSSADAPGEPESLATVEPSEPARKKSPLLFVAAAVLVLGGIAGTLWFTVFNRPQAPPPLEPKPLQAAAVQKPLLPSPVVVTTTPATTASTSTAPPTSSSAPDEAAVEAAKKKAIEEEVNRRINQEVLKLQAQYDEELKKRQPPASPTPTPNQVATDTRAETPSQREAAVPSAAELDRSNLEARSSTQPPLTESVATGTAPPTATTDSAAPPLARPQMPPQPAVKEGDLVGVTELDTTPQALSEIRPVYPPLAARQKIEGVVILSCLITETGHVQDVMILRGDKQGLGFDQAAIRAVRSTRFSPGVKDGKKVRTWLPIPIRFKME
ncbi:MAG: TonB family protein [Thermoanaerobaculia bacterium]